MKRSSTREWICAAGLVPVLRAPTAETAMALVRAMHAGGVDVIEVTTTVPEAAGVLRALRAEFGEALMLGAGTVTTKEECIELIAAGAEFVVSPSLHPDVIATAKAHGKLMIAGALTPTEIITAWRAGADIVKVFPCSAVGGAGYLRSIQGPFPQIPLIPTGGVTVKTARDFLEAGAIALGVGSDLADVKAIRSGNADKVTATAREYMAIFEKWLSER